MRPRTPRTTSFSTTAGRLARCTSSPPATPSSCGFDTRIGSADRASRRCIGPAPTDDSSRSRHGASRPKARSAPSRSAWTSSATRPGRSRQAIRRACAPTPRRSSCSTTRRRTTTRRLAQLSALASAAHVARYYPDGTGRAEVVADTTVSVGGAHRDVFVSCSWTGSRPRQLGDRVARRIRSSVRERRRLVHHGASRGSRRTACAS